MNTVGTRFPLPPAPQSSAPPLFLREIKKTISIPFPSLPHLLRAPESQRGPESLPKAGTRAGGSAVAMLHTFPVCHTQYAPCGFQGQSSLQGDTKKYAREGKRIQVVKSNKWGKDTIVLAYKKIKVLRRSRWVCSE